MKLRFRSIDGREVTKLEVPNPCTLRKLQRILLDHIPPLSPSPSPSSVRFSLNRNDELRASSGDETIQSLGVTSGDLLFYSLLPQSSQNPSSSNPEMINSVADSKSPGGFLSGDAVKADLSQESLSLNSRGSVSGAVTDDSGPSVREIDLIGRERRDVDSAALDAQDNGAEGNSCLLTKDMDLDVDDPVAVCSKFSEPYFLRRVLSNELKGNRGDAYNCRSLVLAVHAVLMESGFVNIDPATKMPVDGFHLPELWPSPAFSMSLHYSFPEILLGHGDSPESIFLRFQILGEFMNVYGGLDKGKWDLRRVCLNQSVLLPKIESVLLTCDSNLAKGVFEFWKIVKDNLALPLSIDLLERAGLLLPSCFSSLPVELKGKILKLLNGVDLAKVACVCSELRYLSADNDLWKCKVLEEFGERVQEDHGTTSRADAVDWKQVFRWSWKEKEKWRKRELQVWPLTSAQRLVPSFNRIRRDPCPLGGPYIIGGDYDRLPALGIPQPHGGLSALPVPRNLFRRGVSPCCNLGGPGRQ